MKKRFQRLQMGSLLLLFGCVFSVSAADKESATARRLAREGYVNIQKEDPSIHVSLMYGRADNFCGMVLKVKHTNKDIYVSNPAHGGGMHNYGMAVDITLCTLKGDTLDMGTKIDYMGMAAHIDHEDRLVSEKKISPKARENRQLLRKVMRHGGFIPLRTEWWHFNKCSRATAKKYYKVIP